LRAKIETGTYATKTHPDVPFILASVIHDPHSGATTILALNRNASDAIQLEVELRGLGAGRKVTLATELHHGDLKAINTKDSPDEVAPRNRDDVAIDGEFVRVKLKPLSWNVIVTETGSRQA
jgi:alpha-N-arabinofuranosidase